MAKGRKNFTGGKQLRRAVYEKIGFLTNCWPRESFGKLFEERIKLTLGPECPKFYCYSDTMTIGGHSAHFMMVKTTNKDSESLTRLLRTKMEGKSEEFVPWKWWLSMVEGRKASIVKTQETLQNNITSVQDAGYSDDNTIVMGNSRAIELLQAYYDKNKEDQEEEPTNLPPIREWTINQFIAHHYKDIEGNAIFKHCYRPLDSI
jgi:hypothetical protein